MKTLQIDGYPLISRLAELAIEIEDLVEMPEPLVEWAVRFETDDPEEMRQETADAILNSRPALFLID